ncbi:MAG: M23 family metallopeptidase [Aminipila sp.]
MIVFNHLPVSPLRVTSKFGPRNTGIKGASTFHKGIDLGRDFLKAETVVMSVADGTVFNNYWNDYKGWVVIIDHGNFKTLYQHLKCQSPLAKGQRVKAGQQIGIMGASTKNIKNMAMHLHMELIVNGKQIDSLPYLQNIQEVEDLTETEVRKIVKEMLSGSGDTPSSWAKEAWEEATEKGITDGTKPQGSVTREQVVVMLNRAK